MQMGEAEKKHYNSKR